MFKQVTPMFFDDQDLKFWQPYRRSIHLATSVEVQHEGIIHAGDVNNKPKTYFFQLFKDHLVRYEDYKEFKTNSEKAHDTAKILFLTTINVEIFELPEHPEFNYNLELTQNKVVY